MNISPTFPTLPKNIQLLLSDHQEEKWIEILDNAEKGTSYKGEYLATLFQHIVGTNLNDIPKKLSMKLFPILRDKYNTQQLSETAKTTYKNAKAIFKEQVALNKKNKLLSSPSKKRKIETNDKHSLSADSRYNFKRQNRGETSLTTRNSSKTLSQLGLKNLGVTCYMNTVLQFLAWTPDFDQMLTGEIPSDTITQDKKNKLQKLQRAIFAIITQLRHNNKNSNSSSSSLSSNKSTTVSEQTLKNLINELYDCGFIENKYHQYDGTEIFSRLLGHFGGHPPGIQMQLISEFPGVIKEIQPDAQQSNFFPLKTLSPNQTIQSLLNLYFESTESNAVRFIVKNKETGEIIKRLQYTDVLNPEIGISLHAHARQCFTSTTTKPSDNEIEDMALTLVALNYSEDFGNSIEVNKVKLQQSLQITSLPPPIIQVRLDKQNGNPIIDESISLATYFAPNIHYSSSSSPNYSLESVMCRSGSQTNSSGGHFWFWRKEGSSWIKYNDSTVTSYSSPTEAFHDFNQHAYACFYRQKPIPNIPIFNQLPKELKKICVDYIGVQEDIANIFRKERHNLYSPSEELKKKFTLIASYSDMIDTLNLDSIDFWVPQYRQCVAIMNIGKCLPNITDLNLSNGLMLSDSLKALATYFPKLKRLNLSRTEFGCNTNLTELLALSRLKTIILIDSTSSYGCGYGTVKDFSHLKRMATPLHIEIIDKEE